MGSILMALCPMLMSAQDDVKSELDSLRQEVADLNAERDADEAKLTQKRLWGYGRYKRISYVVQNMTCSAYDGIPATTWEPKVGFGLQIGTTYHLPHKPLAGIIKFGIDATWFDFTYAGYKDAKLKSASTVTPGVTDGIPDFVFPEDYPEQEVMLGNLGVHQLSVSLGIGPSINIAPFAFSSNKNLQMLKAQVYGHFLMGVSGILYTNPNNDDTEFNFAALPQGACGVSFNWRQLGLGFEGRWGSAKYKNLVSQADFEDDEEEGVKAPKLTFKNAAFRVYLNFHF